MKFFSFFIVFNIFMYVHMANASPDDISMSPGIIYVGISEPTSEFSAHLKVAVFNAQMDAIYVLGGAQPTDLFLEVKESLAKEYKFKFTSDYEAATKILDICLEIESKENN